MIKRTALVLLVLFLQRFTLDAQTRYRQQADSLKLEIGHTKSEGARLILFIKLLNIYCVYQPNEGLKIKNTVLDLAGRVDSKIDIARVNDKIGRIYWKLGKFSDAYRYHFAALEGYNAWGDNISRNYVLIELGQDYLNDTNFEEARIFLQLALKRSTETGDKTNMFNANDKLIALYENMGDYAALSKTTYDNLSLAETMDDKILLAYAQAALAYHLQTQGNYTDALKYYQQSLQLSLESNDENAATSDYRFIAEIYQALGNFKEAEIQLRKGLSMADSMENPIGIYTYLNRSLGNLYKAEGKYSEALHYLRKATGELRTASANIALSSLYAEIGMLYTRLRQFDVAEKYLDSSQALCKKLNTKINFADYYIGRQMLDSATGNWKDAYLHYRQYANLKDSTFNREVLGKMVNTQIQYNDGKKELLLKARQEKKDIIAQGKIEAELRIRNFSLAGLGALLLFSVIVYRQRNKLAKEKKRSDDLLKENELLLKEIHHRVKNNLEVVSSLLALQSDQIDNAEIKAAMVEGQNRVHSIGLVHQKLYQGSNLGVIEMKDYFLNLSDSILDSFGAQKRVSIECEMEPLEVDIDTAVPLGLIVNELLTNTIKYAFPNGQCGKVTIQLKKNAAGVLLLELADNGIGKSSITHGTGFGEQLIRLLTHQLCGTMKEEINSGTHFFFEFKPIKAA